MSDEKLQGTALVAHSSFLNEAYQRLGLPQYIYTGVAERKPHEVFAIGKLNGLPPDEHSDFAQWLFKVVDEFRRIPTPNRAQDWPLPYEEYLEAIAKREKIGSALHREHYNGVPVFISDDSPELRHFVTHIYKSGTHSRDFAGYADYLGKVNGKIFSGMMTMMGHLTPEILVKDHRLNAYIVGARNSGKSETLKQLVHHYVKHPELGGILFLDPHGKASQEIAQWREFAGEGAKRLVYLDAKAQPLMQGLTPALNPIRPGSVDADDLMDLAVQLAESFSYTVRENDPFTANMRRLLEIGIYVLLKNGGGTLVDLQDGFLSKDGGKLARLGRADERPIIRQHYERLFFDSGYQSSKEAIARRIEEILLNPACERMLTLPNEIDLLGALESGKVVVVNCASAGEQKAALGRLLMAQVAALGNRRLHGKIFNGPRIHVFADEATLLIAPPILKIMQELRKVGISLTLAQQNFGQAMDDSMLESVLTGTEIKMFGVSKTLGSTFKKMGWHQEKIPPLKNGEFVVAIGTRPKQVRAVLATNTNLADDANAMEADEWEAVLSEQFAAYYRQPHGRKSPDLQAKKQDITVQDDDFDNRTWERP